MATEPAAQDRPEDAFPTARFTALIKRLPRYARLAWGLAGEPRLAPHLQVPMQSGSATILRAMRRNYDLETYLDRLQRLDRA